MGIPIATLAWNGYEVTATITCVCGVQSEKDVDVEERVVECSNCGRLWKPRITVECDAATPSEREDYMRRQYGKGPSDV